jgi:hypothetical protein
LDHFDNTGRLNTFFEDPITWSLDGGAAKEAEKICSITTCRSCFATFRSGPVSCPYCGLEIPKNVREVETVRGELEEARRTEKMMAVEEWRKRVTGDERRAKFDEFRRIAKERNYSPRWPWVKFRVIFGHEPPPEWMHR